MKAVWITKHGGPGVLAVRESADPEPGPLEVRVRVAACGLNFAEVMARKGLYPDAPKPPCVVGYEGAGTVDRVGERVTNIEVGARVVFFSAFGGHSDVVVTRAERVFAIPDGKGFEEAAALPVNYLTAYHMLFRLAGLRPGRSVFVHAAAGGVGTAVLQLCRTVPDVTTYGTCSESKHAYARANGLHHPIDYHRLDYASEVMRLSGGCGVDLVLDPLGGDDWRKGYQLLRRSGILIAFGLANANIGGGRRLWNAAFQLLRTPRFSPMTLMGDNRGVCGCNMGHMFEEAALLTSHMEALIELWRGGAIKPHVAATFPFARAADAHGELEYGRNCGKIVLVPQ